MIPSIEERELLHEFESCTLPSDRFHHAENVRVGWLYLHMFPFCDAVRRFREALQSFALAHGKATLFHETITFAYVALVNERIERQQSPTWNDFMVRNPDLLTWSPSVLTCYY